VIGRGRIDPVARQLTLALAAGRIGVGVAATGATDPALQALGFPEPGPTGRAVARVLGARDLTLGALTLAAREDRAALRAITLAAAALDAADAIAFGTAAGDPSTRRAGLGGLLTAAAAALAGLWAWRRLA
jgi:uncharacterized protein DUF4267